MAKRATPDEQAALLIEQANEAAARAAKALDEERAYRTAAAMLRGEVPMVSARKGRPLADAHRAAISRGVGDDDAFTVAMRAAGYASGVELAAKLGVSPSHLSRLRSGVKTPAPKLAAAIEKLIGFRF